MKLLYIKTHVRPKKLARHTHELLTGRTIMQFSCIRSSVTLQRHQLIFALEMPANVITSHSKFQLNHIKCFRDMSLQKFAEFFIFFFFLLLLLLFFFFLTNKKSCQKMQTHYLIIPKFGTQQDDVSVHCGNKFGCNTINDYKDKNNY